MATQYFGGNNLSAIGTITAIAVVLTSGISALFGNFTSVQSIYTSSTNMYAANIVATSSAVLPSNTKIDTKDVCLADGTNCLAGSTPSLAQVTAVGATTTQTLQLMGGFLASSSTVTSTFTVLGDTSLQGLTFTSATATNVTSTNLFATTFAASNGNITNLTINSLQGGSVTGTTLSFASGTIATLNGTTANIGTGNFNTGSFTSLLSSSGTILGFNFTNATGSNVTSTNLFVSGTASTSQLFVNGQNVCLANGVNCPVAGSTPSLAQVTAVGATSSQALVLTGGGTGNPAVSITNVGGNQSGLKLSSSDASLYGTIDWLNDAGAQAQMLMAGSAFDFGIFTPNSATFYNYSGSMMNLGTVSGAVNLFAGGYALTDIRLSVSSTGITAKSPILSGTNNSYTIGAFDSAFAGVYSSSTSYFSNVSSSALTVNSVNVCLADGTNCPASSGAQTLAQVTALGQSSTNTLLLYAGFVGASSTVTSTFTVLGNSNFQNATATNVTTSRLAVYSQLTAATTTMNGSFYSNTGTVALPSISLKGDTDTGLYSAAANQLGITTGGSASLLVSASAISAGSNNTRTLGTQSIQWTTIFGTSVSSTYSTATVAVIGSSLYPSANNAASIGTNVRAFANIFASGTINGVNVTSTGAAIDFPGIGAPGATSDLVCWTAVTGRLTHQATNCTVSSVRFKEHITGLNPSDMMEVARKLRAVQYIMKDDGKAQQGFIAEEVAMIDPFLVVWEEATDEMRGQVLESYPDFKFLVKNGKEFTPRTVDYARVSVVLSGAVNDLDRRLTELEKRVSFLEYLWNAVRSLFK